MKLSVLGAGAWGTALAHCAAARHDVMLWARDPAQANLLEREGGKLGLRNLNPGVCASLSLPVLSQ